MSAVIYQLPMQVPGMVGVLPNPKFMVVGDNLATLTTAGYLNQVSLESNPVAITDVIQCLYSFNPATQSGTYGVFSVSISNGVITLSLEQSAGEVTLPTIANHIATYTNVSGGLSEDAATAINGGNLQAGLSGTAGTVASFPSAVTSGKLVLAAVTNSGGNFNTTISNASSVGQSQVVSVPDGGVATSNFIISNSAGTQTIATGSLALTAGNVTATAGNLQAGSSGHAGTVASFPGTAGNGELILAAVNAGGAFNTTISNGTTGQSQVISIPDSGASTANFIVSKFATTQHITSGALQVDAGAVSSGISTGGFVGLLKAFPTTATSGFIALQGAVNGSGNFGATISNSTSQAQATVYTLPDVTAATANILSAGAALVSGNLVQASGTAGAVIDSGLSAAAQLSVVSIAVTAAEFNGMYAAPKLLIATPGANNMIVVTSMQIIQTYGSAPFAAGGVVAAQYDSTVHGAGVLATNTEAAADFFQTASTTYSFIGTSGNTVGILPFTTTANKGLYLSNQTQAFTTGTGSSFVVKVFYRIIAVA